MDLEFRILSVLVFLPAIVVRLYFYLRNKEFSGKPTKTEGSGLSILRRLILAIGQLLALFYVLGIPWLIGLSLDVPIFIKWLGVCILILSSTLTVWVHGALGIHFSRTLKIKDTHKLVTTGPYHKIRHPMYSAFILMWLGFFLLSSNPLIGFVGLAYLTLVVIRISKEEKMLQEHFQEEYENYIQQTGRLFPKLGKIKWSW